MSFVQLAFFSFLPVTLVAYHSAWGYVRLQQFILLAASMFFYAWWDWRFLGWLLLSIGVAYAAAIAIERGKHKKLVLAIGISVLLLILVYFKYMNFFVASFVAMLRSVGFEQSVSTLQIILPIGISFYTFQAIAYMMDVYRKEISGRDRCRPLRHIQESSSPSSWLARSSAPRISCHRLRTLVRSIG